MVTGAVLRVFFSPMRLGSGHGSSTTDRCDGISERPRNAASTPKPPKVERYEQCLADCEIETYVCMPTPSAADVSTYVARKQTCDTLRARCDVQCVLDVAPSPADADPKCGYCIDLCRCPGVSLETMMPCICDCRMHDGCGAAKGELEACMHDFGTAAGT